MTITIPYQPTELQKTLHNNQARYRVVVCGRRAGKSTFALNEAIKYCILKLKANVWIVCPTFGQAKDIYWRNSALMGKYLIPDLYNKKNESELLVEFINGSVLQLKGSDRPETLRGSGIDLLIIDEVAEHKDWKNVWNQILEPTLTDTKGKAIFIGTPKGFNHFYELYLQEKTNQEYKSFQFKTSDNPYIDKKELEFKKLMCISELDKIIYRQEYDACFEMVTGRARFDIDKLILLRQSCIKPIRQVGFWSVYKEMVSNHKYIIGVDVAEGLEIGDNSVACILDAITFEQAAKFRGKIEPDAFGRELAIWGSKYNKAMIAVEVNNHGLTTLTILKDIYSNIFYRKIYDKIADQWTEKIGWQTSAKTKPFLIDHLATALQDNLSVLSTETIDELMTFVVNEDGSCSAQEGKYDDEVIALAIANQVYLEGIWNINKEPDKPLPRYCVARIEQEAKEKRENWRENFR